MQEKISVIMGTYNPSISQIKTAIESIVSQSFRDWRMIICDDGSDEHIANQIKEIVNMDKRITLLRNETNLGLGNALNNCIVVSRGEYIARMDDDDISATNRFSLQKEFLDNNTNYGWVGCLADLYDEDGVWGKARRPEMPQKQDFLHSSPFIHPGVMFRREVIDACGGYPDSPLTSRCEDYELFMSLYSLGYRGYNIQKPLLKYHQNRDALKRSWRFSCNEAVIRFRGFRNMKILNPITSIYVIKPILVRIAAYMPVISQHIRTHQHRGDVCDVRR